MSATLIERIINNPQMLSVRFQPIFRLGAQGDQIDSLEGLVRGPEGTHFEGANLLFDYVRRKRAEAAIDRSCIIAICRAVAELPADYRVNLNVHASTLGQNTGFVEFFSRQARNLSLALDRFTLEIVEHSPTHNVPGLIASLRALRDMGVKIALDDVGLGHSNYRMIIDCHPDYFKLDAFFVEGVSYDPFRRAVAKSVMCLAQEMKGSIVAEGARSVEDMSTLTEMGINLFQANLLCPPMRTSELVEKGFLSLHHATAASVGSGAYALDKAAPNSFRSTMKPAICQ
jgi:EAL domain-containing protein (putative c-di-GMP-specific phosphodiesterase class I)